MGGDFDEGFSRDPTEFEEYFRRDFLRLVGFVMTLGAEQSAAEDAAQTAFAAAFVAWDHIRCPGAWVRKVATRAYFKNRNDVIRLGDQPEDAPVYGYDIADQVAQSVLVLMALQRLPSKQRVVMAWTVDGYSPAQIAEAMGVSAESVRKALQRARENLKGMLGTDDDGRRGAR